MTKDVKELQEIKAMKLKCSACGKSAIAFINNMPYCVKCFYLNKEKQRYEYKGKPLSHNLKIKGGEN